MIFKNILFTLNILIFIVFNFYFTNNVIANYISVDKSLFSFKEFASRFEKIFLIPIRKNRLMNKSESYYVKELFYHFHRLGFNSPPFHYVVFENGKYFRGFDDLDRKATFLPTNTSSINIFLIYDNRFYVTNFRNGLSSLLNFELSKLILSSDITSYEDIVVLDCDKILRDNVSCQTYQPAKNDIFFFEPYLSAPKIKPNIRFTLSNNTFEFDPGIISEIPITIYNESDFYVFWNEKNPLEIRTQNNSVFYINDLWLTPRTIRTLSFGSIQPKGTMVVYIKIKIPLLANIYREKLLFYFNSELISEGFINVRVKDIGQKVLRVNNNNVGMVNVYENPNLNANVIARVPSRSEFLFYEFDGNFYKIKIQGVHGWVSKNNVQIIKD